MLPTDSRLHSPREFAAVTRSGRRAGTRHLVVYVLGDRSRSAGPRDGFVVSAKVGNAVVRHRVTRRLRPLVRRELSGLAPGTDVVVRALPTAATAGSVDLAADLRAGLVSAARKAGVTVAAVGVGPRAAAPVVTPPEPQHSAVGAAAARGGAPATANGPR